MKKLLLSAIFCVLATSFVYAEDVQQAEEPASTSINLELTQPQKTYNLQRPNYTKNVNTDKTVTNSQEVLDYSKTNPNQKRTANFGKKKKFKDVSVGTQSSYTTTSDTCSGSNTLYTEYEKKNFKLNTGYTRTASPAQNNADKGSVSVTPEYKINKHVSIQNKYSTDLNTDSKKGEVKLNVQPFKDDRMDMGVGVGQKYSNTSPSSSQVNFSTNIRF